MPRSTSPDHIRPACPVREALPDARLAFGGPGKTDDELRLALDLGVERIHVESPYELSRLADIARTAGREVDVGGGMAVDYSTPETHFDWKPYGADIAALAEPGETLRIEPGRAISVYAG